jgi:hypothetical protein
MIERSCRPGGAIERFYILCLGEEAKMCNMQLRERQKAHTREKSKYDGVKEALAGDNCGDESLY